MTIEMHGHRIFGVSGWKNSGKTTLATRLVAELCKRGFKISSVKHAHHKCDIDKEGTDSYRHREAGATEVALVAAGTRWAIMHECRDEAEPTLSEILARLAPCDLIIVEGFKNERFPKLQVLREEARQSDLLTPEEHGVVARASDRASTAIAEDNLPIFDLEDVEKIADFIVDHVGLKDRVDQRASQQAN